MPRPAAPGSRSVVATSAGAACAAGASANSSTVPIATIAGEPHHASRRPPRRGESAAPMAAQIRSAVPTSIATRPAPPRAPRPASTMPSTSNCCTMRHRPAPIDSRMAISRWRAEARASNSPARFAQVISSTTAGDRHQDQQHRPQHADAAVRRVVEREHRRRDDRCSASGSAHVARICSRIASSSARACSRDDPGARRASSASQRLPRSLQPIAARHHDRLRADRQPHVVATGPRPRRGSPAPATPTIVNGCALIFELPCR